MLILGIILVSVGLCMPPEPRWSRFFFITFFLMAGSVCFFFHFYWALQLLP